MDHFKFERETIPVSMSLYERYMAKYQCDDRHRCQLIAVTALYIALKVHEKRRKDTLSFFCELSSGCFTEQHIAAMEIEMLMGLNWLVNPPTPQAFLYLFTRLLAPLLPAKVRSVACHRIYEVSNFICEVSLLQNNIRGQNASTIATASFFIAIAGVHDSLLNSRWRSDIIADVLALCISTDSSTINYVSILMKANLVDSGEGQLSLQDICERLDANEEVYASQ